MFWWAYPADSPLAIGSLLVNDTLGTELRIWRLQTSVLELSGSQAQHAQHAHSGDNESFHFCLLYQSIHWHFLRARFSFLDSRRTSLYRPIGWHWSTGMSKALGNPALYTNRESHRSIHSIRWERRTPKRENEWWGFFFLVWRQYYTRKCLFHEVLLLNTSFFFIKTIYFLLI